MGNCLVCSVHARSIFVRFLPSPTGAPPHEEIRAFAAFAEQDEYTHGRSELEATSEQVECLSDENRSDVGGENYVPAQHAIAQIQTVPAPAQNRASSSSERNSTDNSSSASRGIDYSKWNAIVDSDEEKGVQDVSAASSRVVSNGVAPSVSFSLVVQGFTGKDAFRLNGGYSLIPRRNHGCPVFRRPLNGNQFGLSANPSGPPDKVAHVVLYYWDSRDGIHLNGWWFGPDVGANTVWAFNPGEARQPPRTGWCEPWFADASPDARVIMWSSNPEEIATHASPPSVDWILGETRDWLRRAPTVWRCVDCLGHLRSPVALPCGHLVCLEHTKAKQAYSCPWAPGCSPRRFPGDGLGPEDWRPAGVVERLLEFLPRPQGESLAKEREDGDDSTEDEVTEAVYRARSPQQLVSAYEALGDARGSSGRSAEAALAFAAARYINEEFGWTMEESPSIGIISIEVLATVIQTQKIIQVKAAAWAKRCGNAAELDAALVRLPVPKLQALEPSVEDFAARLKGTAGESPLQALVECPVCFSMVFEPVTTPCGHTYCKRCLARSLDWENGCPLCRCRLPGFVDNYCICKPLQDLLSTLWAEEHKRQVDESLAELKQQRDGPWLSILVCNVAFPLLPYNLHVYEPRYRLMIRRVLSSGTHRFGVCAPANEEGELPDYGTEVLITNTRMLPDGRSLVETVGARRFRILENSVKDGYSSARVEYLEDREESGEVDLRQLIQQILARLHSLREALNSGPADARSPLQASARRLQELVLPFSYGPSTPIHQCDEFAWNILCRLPVPHEAKYRFLAMQSKTERWSALIDLLQNFEESLLSVDLHVRVSGLMEDMVPNSQPPTEVEVEAEPPPD